MKRILFFVILQCLFQAETLSQNAVKADSCQGIDGRGIDTFIPGYVDTVYSDGQKGRAIDASLLMNGFELQTRDSAYKIERFMVTFDGHNESGSFTLFQKPSVGNKMYAEENKIVPLRKIRDATLITIDMIIIRHQGKCFYGTAHVYVAR